MLENTSAGLSHPEMLEGRRIWLDPEVEDLIDRLHHGDATLGWAGDPALALYRTEDRRWELWRLESNGHYGMVARSKPGLALDSRLIMHLVAHDMRKGYNPHTDIIRHNAKVDKAKAEREEEARIEAISKVVHALVKDVGHHY
jgi:hypothetical protein